MKTWQRNQSNQLFNIQKNKKNYNEYKDWWDMNKMKLNKKQINDRKRLCLKLANRLLDAYNNRGGVKVNIEGNNFCLNIF